MIDTMKKTIKKNRMVNHMKYTGRLLVSTTTLILILTWYLMKFINDPKNFLDSILINGNIIYEIIYIN